MARYLKRPVEVEAITFDEFVEFGLKQPGANIVGGMPWSFDYQGYPVTHEDDNCYLIPTPDGTMRMERGDMLITGVEDEIYPCNREIFKALGFDVRERPATYEDVTSKPTPSIEQLMEVANGNLMAFLKRNTNERVDYSIGDKVIYISRHGTDLSEIILNLSKAEAASRCRNE